MKAGILAVAAAIASGVAGEHHAARRHAHKAFHMEGKRNPLLTTAAAPEPTCGCTTIYSTFYGEPTLYFPPPPPPPATSSVAPPPSTTPKPTPTSTPAPVVPTAFVTTCPTPGTYTIPATTITLTSATTVCAPVTTHVPSGTYTAGGVTTVVTTETTVVCPYATTGTSEGVVTSTILTTTYVCPTAGTYTIAPLTTTVSKSTVWVYPTPATYAPGTYTQSEETITVTETDFVYVCPFTSPAPAPAAPTSAPAPVAPAPAPVAPAPVYSASPAPVAPSPKPAPAASSSGQLGSTNGQPYGITYTPYTAEGGCKAASDVMSDVAQIAAAGFDVLRVYSSDCSALTNVGAACEAHGVKMILGVFIKGDGPAGAQQQVTDIIAWGKWELVVMIIVGNEALMQGFCSPSDLAGFISSCKSSFAGAGYSGPISTAEPLSVWQEHADALCPVIDILGCNIHAFFNPDTDASNAGPFVKSQLDIADELCPGKYAINTESGWPSQGSCNGKACPGPSEQAAAIASIKESVGAKSIVFSYQNDLWKNPGAFNCEQSWGVMHLFE